MKPTFSVILPCWNSINFIERSITSLKNQTYKNFEVIIIDDSSSDGTLEKINEIKDSRMKVYRINSNRVVAKSRNLGIEKSQGEWIAFLDSDDWWTQDKLEYCKKYINGEVDLIYHDLQIETERSKYFNRKQNKSCKLKKPILIDLLIKGNVISNSSVVVRKNLIREIGGINESRDLAASEDYNTWLRIASLTDRFLFLPRILGYYFLHDKSYSNKDMSSSTRFAVEEFFSKLNETQKLKVESNLRYQSSRFNYQNSNFKKAKQDLFFIIKNGNFSLKIRAFVMIIMMILK